MDKFVREHSIGHTQPFDKHLSP